MPDAPAYSAHFAPRCSSSTISRPISQFATTCVVFTVREMPACAAAKISRNRA